MNAQTANQNDPQQNIELRIRSMRILWFGMFMSTLLYYGLTFFVRAPVNTAPNSMLFLVLVVIALSITLISFLIKNRLLARAVEQQQPQLVQQSYIVALALTEVAALLGLLYFFMTGDRYYPILFVIGACGQLLHFPRRQHVVNASFKKPLL